MKVIIDLIVLSSELLFFIFSGVWICLWWTHEISKGNMIFSLAVATLLMMAMGNYFYKNIAPERRKKNMRFFIYAVLAGISFVGYLYGLLLAWLHKQ